MCVTPPRGAERPRTLWLHDRRFGNRGSIDVACVGALDVVAVVAPTSDITSALIAIGSALLCLGGIVAQVADPQRPADGAHTVVAAASPQPLGPHLPSRIVWAPRGGQDVPADVVSHLSEVWPGLRVAELGVGFDRALRLGA